MSNRSSMELDIMNKAAAAVTPPVPAGPEYSSTVEDLREREYAHMRKGRC
jgi:hypothetical protein